MEDSKKFWQAVTALAEDGVNDHEADMMLQRWSCERVEEELLAGCYAVLTSTCAPPRLGATMQAVRLASATRCGTAWLWDRLMSEAGQLSKEQMSNWIAGFYYQRFDPSSYSRFVKLASLTTRKYDRMGIAIMLSTWSSVGTHQSELVKYIDELTVQNRE